MLQLKLQYSGHVMRRVDSLEKTLMLGGIGGRRRRDDRGWDGWMASLTRWKWIWVNSGSWWWTGRPGVLRFMGSQRVGHDWATELNWTDSLLDKGDLFYILNWENTGPGSMRVPTLPLRFTVTVSSFIMFLQSPLKHSIVHIQCFQIAHSSTIRWDDALPQMTQNIFSNIMTLLDKCRRSISHYPSPQ